MYNNYIKRLLDIILSLSALVILSPLLILLTCVGLFIMRGNPFYVQKRPGKRNKDGKEKIINLIKFRSMNNKKDKDGNLLPGKERLNRYGIIIRAASLDELPSLINILIGDISIVGPRPLDMKYLPYYTEQERHRHDVRPGLTGLAQINGRNNLSWEQKFAYDLEYIKNISLLEDMKILFMTVKKVFIHEGIGQGEETPINLNIERKDWILREKGAVKPN